jgi:hypothetical protein
LKIPANSLMARSIDSVGYFRTGKVLQIIVCWAYAMHHVDAWPEGLSDRVRAYSEDWIQSERTGWDHLNRFRRAFPDEVDPTRFAQRILDEYSEQLRTQDEARAFALSGRFATIII